MFKRFLSHVLISLAVFTLTATLFMWTIDGRVLNPEVLSGELRKANVSQELAQLMPDVFTGNEEDITLQELAEIEQAISQAVTADYVDEKITDISYSLLTFVREGAPEPVIDLSDFPERVKSGGLDIGDEFDENFSTPILLNEDGKLDPINDGYNIFSTLKYAGLVLFALLLLAEWFVAEKGKKIKVISRVFLYAGLWFMLYYALVLLLPRILGDSLRSSVQSEQFDASGLVDAVVRALQGLFASYFLTFGVGCLFIAVILYLIRHFKHGDVGKTVPTKGS
jgi:hypothetical protein